jgi:hypothetical protein
MRPKIFIQKFVAPCIYNCIKISTPLPQQKQSKPKDLSTSRAGPLHGIVLYARGGKIKMLLPQNKVFQLDTNAWHEQQTPVQPNCRRFKLKVQLIRDAALGLSRRFNYLL